MADINTVVADIITALNDAQTVAVVRDDRSRNRQGCVHGARGSGAVTTIDNTAGTLLSAGVFTAGDKIVGNGDTVNVSYTMSV